MKLSSTGHIIYPLLISALLVMATPAWAKDVIRVAFSEHPPWKTLLKNGVHGGIDLELVRLVAKRMNLDVEFVHYPFKRSLKMVEVGDIDIMTGVFHRPERETMFYYIQPAYKKSSDKAFFVLKGHELHVERHEDLRSLSIGTTLGSKYYPAFDEDQTIEKHPVSNADLNVKMLQAGRIDAFIMTESTGDFLITKHGQADNIVKLKYAYRSPQSVYIVLSKVSPLAKRQNEFNKVMQDLINEGTMEKLKKQFYQSMRPR